MCEEAKSKNPKWFSCTENPPDILSRAKKNTKKCKVK